MDNNLSIEYILNKLENIGFKLIGNIENTNYYLEKDNVVLSITTPHSGNEYKYLIRHDYKEIFDRWSNCYYENSADTIEKIGNILEDIEYFVLNKDEELKEYYLEN